MKNQEIVYNGSSDITAALVRQSTVRNNDDLIVCGEQEWDEILTVIKFAEDEDGAAVIAAKEKRLLETTRVSFCDIKSRLRKINRCIDKLVLRAKVSPARKQTMRVKKNRIRKAPLRRTEKKDLYDFCPLCPEDELISEYTLPCLIH